MENINIGFKYNVKSLDIFKNPYFMLCEVIGVYYKYNYGGTSYFSKNNLLKNNPVILQISKVDPYYKYAEIFTIEKDILIGNFIEDAKLKDEFRKYHKFPRE